MVITCLVAIKNKKGKIVMGADRRVSWGGTQYQESAYAKIKKDGGTIMSFCGDCAVGNLVVNIMKRPKVVHTTEIYMYYILPEKIKKFLVDRGFTSDGKMLNIAEGDGNYVEFIVALDGRLFEIKIENNNVVVDEIAIPYCSGSGGHVAWGSLLTTENMGIKSRERVRLAIEASSKVVHSVDSHIDICVED